MPKFRKKPVVVEAHQLKLPKHEDGILCCSCDDNEKSPIDIAEWIGNLEVYLTYYDSTIELTIPTLEGNMVAKEGDWIIKGVNGEFYPCKDDIFQKTYELVE